MKKIGIIIFREYWTRVRKKSFIITTLVGPLGFALLMFISVGIDDYADSEKVVAIIDQNGYLEGKVMPDKSDKSVRFKFPQLDCDQMRDGFEEFEYDAVLCLKAVRNLENKDKLDLTYFAKDRLSMNANEFVESSLEKVFKQAKIEAKGIDSELAKSLDVKIDLDYQSLESDEKEKEGFAEVAAMVSMMIGMIIYISLFIYGTMIMKGVMEEKTTRIVEVMISSVKPFQLLLAKIIGIGAVGLTQYLAWGVLMMITYIILIPILGAEMMNSGMGSGMEQSEVDQEMVEVIISNFAELPIGSIAIAFLFYFLGGYLLYGSLYASIGAATDDDGELQSLSFPISIPIILSFIISMTILNDPFSNLVVWASIIPFSSPIVMPARMAFDPPMWQVLLSGVLLIGSFLCTTWLAAKIYRTGILMYGKKVTVKEIAKWVIK